MKYSSAVITGFLLLALLAGCTSRNMAQINDSMKAEELFTGWPLSEDYEYYYYGREISPTAFLALDKNYSLESEFWTKIFPTIKMREFWEGEFRIRHFTHENEFKGKEIIAPDGKRVGMVYTRYYWVTAWFPETGTNAVIIPPPEPSTTQSRSGRDRFGKN